MVLPAPPLLVISDRHQARHPLEEVAEAVFAGGCRWFSLREKDLPREQRCDLLAALVALGHRFGAVVTAHQDIEAVVAVSADGVHLPSGASPEAPISFCGSRARAASGLAPLGRCTPSALTATTASIS